MVIHYGESPEQTYFRDVAAKEKPFSPQEEQLWRKYMPQYLKQQPKSADFSDIYSPSVIQEDQKRLKEKKMQPWYKERHSRSKLFEALLWNNIEQQNWLGENVNTVIASEEDDVLRGFDFVLEAEEGGAINRLGVDVVLADNPEQIYKKWDNNVFAAYMSSKRLDALLVRYFKSEAEPKFKHWIQVPRVVIGIDRKHYDKLISAFGGSAEKDAVFQEIRNLFIKEINLQVNQLMELPPNLREKFQKDLLGIRDIIRSLLQRQKQLSWESNKDMDMVFWALRQSVADKNTFSKIVRGEYSPEKRKYEEE